ncbi:uncharacterized protein LOC120331983 [Styela clava]|uniref:uncharacterized protein LOC120331983 n=1 Tax=Styela clava TaxID=7725 RepID=UPI00193A15A5|nr:uncharacterized protein LOC120331983 [Styela clava]
MSEIAGKQVVVIGIHKDGTLVVQLGTGKSWRINSDSVLGQNETSFKAEVQDVESVPGDIIKIKIVQNIRMLMDAKNVPLAFFEYLRLTANLSLVDDDIDYIITYNSDRNVSAYSTTLKKASKDEIEKHSMIKNKVTQIEVGDEVYLDVGSPNYVAAELREVDASDEVIKAMTRSANLIGFSDDGRAVIEYKDGSLYKIKKKFLTVPERFSISETDEGFDYDVAKDIQETVANCVQIIHADDRGGAEDQATIVKILAMTYGSPTVMDLRIISMAATTENICEYLIQMSDWNVEFVSSGTFYITKLKASTQEVKVGLYFNDDDYPPHICRSEKTHWKEEQSATRKESLLVEEGVEAPAAAFPIGNADVPRLQHGMPQPGVVGVDEFRYVCLFDPSLSRNVYFPYINRGEHRTPLENNDEHDGGMRTPNIMNIYNINKVNRITN